MRINAKKEKSNVLLWLTIILSGLLASSMLSSSAYADEHADKHANEYAVEQAVEQTGFCDCSTPDTSSNVICHVPPGNSHNMHTIRVGDPAVEPHLKHGDMLGPCPGDEAEVEDHETVTETMPPCTCADGTPGHLYHRSTATKASSLRSVEGQ